MDMRGISGVRDLVIRGDGCVLYGNAGGSSDIDKGALERLVRTRKTVGL